MRIDNCLSQARARAAVYLQRATCSYAPEKLFVFSQYLNVSARGSRCPARQIHLPRTIAFFVACLSATRDPKSIRESRACILHPDKHEESVLTVVYVAHSGTPYIFKRFSAMYPRRKELDQLLWGKKKKKKNTAQVCAVYLK